MKQTIAGAATPCLLFKCACTSMSQFCRRLRGGADYLPCFSQLVLVLSSCVEVLFVDSEDVAYCFNPSRMRDAWVKFFAVYKP
eukprot:5001188-Pyramimonas_sp.AAC.1